MHSFFWHSLTWQEVVEKLKSDSERGLSFKKAKERWKKFGPNKLPEEKPFSQWLILFDQIKSPLIYILLIAGLISLFFERISDAIIIFGVVLLNTLVGFFQEKRASQALSALKKFIKKEALVIREKKKIVLPAEELALGDIILVKPGDKVPADARLIESHHLRVNEMALTGEWLANEKQVSPLPTKTPLADRSNMIYMGTIVEEGKGKAIVITTGKNTEIGKISQLIREAKEEKTPYQKRLADFAKKIALLVLIISVFLFLEGLAKGRGFLEMFTTALAIAVSAIPEGLPVAMTVILAIGMHRILKRKGLVRKLSSAETLGSTSVICTDKTGTLTQGKIKVKKVIFKKGIKKKLVFLGSLFCNEAFIENLKERKVLRGRPTDKALFAFGLSKLSFKEWQKKLPKIDEIPFDPQKKYLATLHKTKKEKNLLFVGGAPEKIISLSDLEDKEKWQKKLTELAKQGFRVIALSFKEIEKEEIEERDISQLKFLCLLGLADPLRKDVKKAIKLTQIAGIRPIIVTGDHKLTALSIARELGLKIKEDEILEGRDLDKISDKEFREKLKKIKLYARVEPKHKMRIVSLWQERKEIVAMTGDGVNDAPALKKADIGVALGSGTEVAKEASDLILLDDSFNIIVLAIEEGRAILDNIRKVIAYLFSDSFAEIILIGTAIIANLPLPISAVQILWVNLIEGSLPSIALAFEPKAKGLMKQKPIPRRFSLLTFEMKTIIAIAGLGASFLLLGLFFWLLKVKGGVDLQYIQTIIFAGLTINTLFYLFAFKSLRKNIWQINFFSNRFLIFAWLFALIMLMVAVYFPPFQILLKTIPLRFSDWLIILGLGIIQLFLVEITKWLFITRKQP
jgi:Ca2+-transporting ATPase